MSGESRLAMFRDKRDKCVVFFGPRDQNTEMKDVRAGPAHVSPLEEGRTLEIRIEKSS